MQVFLSHIDFYSVIEYQICTNNQAVSYIPGGVGHGPNSFHSIHPVRHHGEKIKNGSFASDLRSFHISRYAINIPEEIV